MAYSDKWGSTEIRDEALHNLSIGWDTTGKNNEEIIAVMLFTPHMSNTAEHYHVELDLAQCKTLKDWLDQHIKRLEETT